MSLLPRLKITAKMVLLVTLMASFSLGIALYLMLQLQRIDRDYGNVINKDARAAVLVSAALFDISETSRLVYGVMTRQDAASMLAVQPRLEQQHSELHTRLDQLEQLLPDGKALLAPVRGQAKELFQHANAIVAAAARWRGDRALEYIDQDFDPLLRRMRTTMEQLRNNSVQHFEQASAQLGKETRAALRHSLIAVCLTLLAALALSLWWSLTRLARPVNLLTRAMQQLTLRNYDHPIAGTTRHDELGQMARALEVFRASMQHADYLEEAKTQAEQLARSKSAFLAAMSHEIRTPLNAIIGLALLALRRPLPDDQRQRLQQIQSASQHLLGIINNILDFSKIESGHLQAEQLPFAPGQLLQDVHNLLQPAASEKGLQLHSNYPGGPATLLGDPLRIRQILLNLGNNAIKFSEQGSVDLQLWPEEQDGQLFLCGQVNDQGIGISPEHIGQLFRPFQQTDASISRRFGGTGLGLAISRSLAELMGGSTGVRSSPGVGSSFWFRVQVEPARLDQLPAEPDTSQRPDQLSGLRLLLVDDNELNRVVASELLQDAGIEVDQADSGERCIEMLQQAADGTYQAVLMDMMMPGLDGCATTRLLRQDPRFTRLTIIALTANTSQEDRAACLAAGMHDLVAKPLDEQQLWATLLRHCRLEPGPGPAQIRQPDTRVQPAPLFDPFPLQKLQQQLTAERFAHMYQLVLHDCAEYARRASNLASADSLDISAARQLAHDLTGVTGHVGLKGLQAHARLLQQAARNEDRDALPGLLHNIAGLAEQSAAAMGQHFTAPVAQDSQP